MFFKLIRVFLFVFFRIDRAFPMNLGSFNNKNLFIYSWAEEANESAGLFAAEKKPHKKNHGWLFKQNYISQLLGKISLAR